MPREDSTFLRFISLEVMLTLCIMLFAIGGTWSTLAGDNEETKEDVAKVQVEQRHIKNSVHLIQIDVATIRANQEAQRNSAKKQQKDIDRILNILERVTK